MTVPTEFSYTRYLAAKKSVDDRALNRQVFEMMAQTIKTRQESDRLDFLEVGCGIGTMVERLWDWGVLVNARYTALDLNPENIAAATARLPVFFQERDVLLEETPRGVFQASRTGRCLSFSFEALDLFHFLDREIDRSFYDILVAHAFLDLVDLETAVPRLLALLKAGGWFYFTLNFDGATLLLPLLDPDLDALIERAYHGTMDKRLIDGQPSGSSQTGRLLFSVLPRGGGRILAAGSSDWVVYPGPEGYPGDEAYFLHYLVNTVGNALRGQGLLKETNLQEWTFQRHRQIDRGELTYIAHQLDFFGVKDG